MVKPKSFRFTGLDAAWPDYTIVAMEGPQQTLEIQKTPCDPRANSGSGSCLEQPGITGTHTNTMVSGFRAVQIDSPEAAVLSFMNEEEVWVVRAKGPGALSLLHQVASRMKLSH